MLRSPAILTNTLLNLAVQTPANPKLSLLRNLAPDEACARLRSSFTTRPVRGTRLLEIRASQDNSDAAAQIANAIAEAYAKLPPLRQRHYAEAEIAEFRETTRGAGYSVQSQAEMDTLLLAMQQEKVVIRVNVNMIDPAVPAARPLAFMKRLVRALPLNDYPLPPPPAHPQRKLGLGLIAFGLILALFGLVLSRRAASHPLSA